MSKKRDLRRNRERFTANRNKIPDFRRQDNRPVERTQNLTNENVSLIHEEQGELNELREQAEQDYDRRQK